MVADEAHTPIRSVEAVPAGTLTLLLELGITPDEIGVDRLVSERITEWTGPGLTAAAAPACAHIDTDALRNALRKRVIANDAIERIDRVDLSRARPGWIDASGGRAASSTHTLRPKPVWTSAVVTVPRAGADERVHLVCAADGYAYRLGSARWLTVGWVGPGTPPMSGAMLATRIAAAGAQQILPDDRIPPVLKTFRRPASAAIPQPAGHATPIGDAALTRDALASQGLSIGLSDACLLSDPRTTQTDMAVRRTEAARRHFAHLTETVSSARYADQPVWSHYHQWIAEAAEALSTVPA